VSLLAYARMDAYSPEDLVERLDFRDKAPEVIDLSPEGGVVKMLKESMIDCVMSDKVSS
jgi:ATP-dependent RNA helicase DDX24/MAK5